jgi:CheY-like chemotaxis protein/nitrogen-specific signal transduction histidine kinase
MSLTENQQDIILDAITLGIRNSTVEFVRFKQKQLEELFKKEAGAQEAVNEVKNAFLINMSHEIRTPMTAILGYIELLREPDLSQSEREDAMERIERSSRALLKLLDDILDFAKIEAGRLTNKPEIFSPAEIANDVIEVMSLTAKQKGIALKIEIDPTTPLSAWSDASRIRQILVNLIGNAIKFTKKGEVKLSVRSDSAQILFFDVQDTGIGIALEDQMKLFKAFSQADSSINRQFGGTGLGLLLSLRLAENLGGSLQLIKSIPGKGSLFRFQTRALPFNFNKLESEASSTNEKNLIDQSAKHILENKRILVVDDAVDNQLLIARFLRGAGAFVELANDGEEALKKVASLNFDLIFMDIQMPKLDGFEATKRLRSNGYEKPIVALSAHALKEEAIRSVEAGCNAHITKPISKKNLIDTVLKYTKNLDFH